MRKNYLSEIVKYKLIMRSELYMLNANSKLLEEKEALALSNNRM